MSDTVTDASVSIATDMLLEWGCNVSEAEVRRVLEAAPTPPPSADTEWQMVPNKCAKCGEPIPHVVSELCPPPLPVWQDGEELSLELARIFQCVVNNEKAAAMRRIGNLIKEIPPPPAKQSQGRAV